MSGNPNNDKGTLKAVAIIGFAFRFPGDLQREDEFWSALIEGKDLVGRIGPERWATEVLEHPKRSEGGRSITFSAGVLSRIDEFDAGFFGISPREAAWLDPQQRLLLELAWESMENAGIPPSRLAGTDCAVYVGISGLDYGVGALDDLPSLTAHTMTGNTLSVAANRLSYVFDLHGPSLAVDTACSSSLVALHHACNALHGGEASTALVGGVNLLLHPYPFVGFTKASMLSARGRCHTFDASGDGYVRSEGGAVVLLKPLDRALADGDTIHGVIRGTGVNADGGRKTGLTIPSRDGQVELMRAVLARSGLAAHEVDYLEAHGTGTAVGDPIETAAIGEVYGRTRPAGEPLPIGSVKANLGHLEPASGMAGLVKALMVLKHRELPPSIHLTTPNPKIDFSGLNLDVVTAPRPCRDEDRSRPLVVGVNSFGFGGANAHVLLQEYHSATAQAESPRPATPLSPPLFLSTRTSPALRELAGRYADVLAAGPVDAYYDLAHTAAYRRDRLDKRLALPVQDLAAAQIALREFADGKTPAGLVQEEALPHEGGMAFVYSGNGSQWAGMGQKLLAESPRFRELIAELEAPIRERTGFSLLAELGADTAAARLDDTAVAQPLLFAVQVAVTTMLREQGIRPLAVTGHSVGEVAAAWACGALDLDQAIRVICARSAAQALTRGTGRMAAVALSEAAVRDALAELGEPDIEIAGLNSPGNVTLSGPLASLEKLGEALGRRNVFFRLLDLDYAFHSRCMDPIEDMLVASLDGLAPTAAADCEYVSTVTGAVLHGSTLGARYWWDNVRQPVRFGEGIGALIDRGCRYFVEIGPHAILQRYITECLAAKDVQGRVLPSLRRDDDALQRLDELALRLHLTGRTDLTALFPTAGRHIQAPNYPWQRERHWRPDTAEGYRLIHRHRTHPLLGWRLKDAAASWENVLDPRTQPWLADHKVGGATVLPGAAFVELALAAASEVFPAVQLDLEELDIIAPIVFDGDHGRSVRIELNPRDGGFQIRSRQRLSDDEWTLNAAGRLREATVTGELTPPPANRAAATDRLDGATHYRLAGLLGLDYGGEFRTLSHAEVLGDILEGTLQAAADDDEAQAGFILHPGALDVCFQSLLGFFRADIEAGRGLPLLPVRVGRLRHFRRAAVASFRVRLLRRSPRSVLAAFELFARDGGLVATLEGCRFRAASVRQHHEAEPARWEIVPRLLAAPGPAATVPLPATHELARQLRAWFTAQETQLDRQSYFRELQPLCDALVIAFAYEAFRDLLANRGEWLQQALTNPDAVAPAGRAYFAWLKSNLQVEGLLVEDGGTWRLTDSDLPLPADIWRTLLRDYPTSLPELVLIGRIGPQLGAILTGEADAVALLQDLRNSHQAETLYEDNPAYLGSRLAVRRVVEQAAAGWPATRRLRILEIAAESSDLPLQLAHAFPSDRVDYVLAHHDPRVCDHLRAEYRDHPFVSVAELDPAETAFVDEKGLPGQFDIVIRRHSLHRAVNPQAALGWTQRLLNPGGLLLVAERHSDLSAVFWNGIDTAFWREGANDAQPFPQLLPAETWAGALSAQGFADIESFVEPAAEGLASGAYLVLAKRGDSGLSQTAAPPANWLLLAGASTESQALAEGLSAQLNAHSQHVVVMSAAAPKSRAAVEHLLRQAGRQFGDIHHVVDLAGLSGADAAASIDNLLERTHCAETLDLLLAIEAAGIGQSRLWILTSGGIPVDGINDASGLDPTQSALWGLGRVIMNEHPALNCTLIDVSGDLPGAAATEALVNELLHPDGEREIALTPRGRFGLRMQRAAASEAAQEASEESRFRLDFHVPGQLRNLVWLPNPERALGEGEIEVRPLATGLNFRDVMYLMGLLPDEAVENGFAGASLGLEFSGVVTRIGQGVGELKVGDAVLGSGPACFASHVITKASAVTLKPEEWSHEAAATVPTVFLTVYYALKQLAALEPGERVLIHGAAGGVGIAAVQLARHLGAEVFATAGSNEKREFVRLLGADHVYDSRSLAFADQILEQTSGEGVDVVLNSLAGEAIRRNLQVLKPFGRFLEIGKRDFFENTPIGLRPFKDNISYFGIDADQLQIGRPELARRLFAEVMELFRDGALSPLPFRAFPAERVVDAFRYMQQARQIGKVVVTFENARVEVEGPPVKRPHLSFAKNATYLVTGGLTGFGLETARWLAERGAGSIVLLGRRGTDTPGAPEIAAEFERRGTRVTILACDVADRSSVQAVLARIRPELPPLRGVLHAAMVIDDALLANLDGERMRTVLAPKVLGAWNLHELTRDTPLDHFILYSSVTTFIGNPGQGNYVAANTYLEGLTALRRAMGLPATCIGWGPIADAGYLTRNETVKESLTHRLGAEALTTTKALAMLERALQTEAATIAVADFDWSMLARLLPSAQTARFAPLQREFAGEQNLGADGGDFQALIAGKSADEIHELVRALVLQEVAQILSISPERIDGAQSLRDLGMDSLMAVELALGLEKRFGVQLPAMLLNEGPTIDRVASRIVERVLGNGADAPERGDALTDLVTGMAAQHGESISAEQVAQTIADVRKEL
ncbi:MAG TPA: SDR family NAD(P)-dependent oxidoreductase [Aromatoleum sp.]|uniref:SDR family NAD(P)-dependent oxidoreductase n=1 Tax=Aromatoleum sp. TaxID=2307007 RepID=UPI002B47100B|nr:SDR family NAD(P)-dependent oxidoreductase [Aromatoleum sp.]HJV25545.1 SDR family NAD(P)-dependent oxidoreductase [Aromatoleum sp.]